MPKRTTLFLILTVCLILWTLSLSSPATAFVFEEAESQEPKVALSLVVTYIQYEIIEEETQMLLSLEGVATGYLDEPELVLWIEDELQQVSFEYMPCPEEGETEDEAVACWKTTTFSLPIDPGYIRYDFTVLDPANDVFGSAWIRYMPNGHPTQCSAVCGG